MPAPAGKVVVLAGGTGGAKLARGMLDVAGEDLVVIANTADDIDIYEAYVSPDPDLCTFWLTDRIDERGWGLEADTFAVMDGLRDLGEEVWFNLGDRDLAIGLHRMRRLREGARLTEALGELGEALGLRARVLPMSDAPVRTWVLKGDDWLPFQEFMIRRRGEGPVDGMELRGIEAATPPPEALEEIAAARAIIIGPSNPVISIKPILDVPGMRDALAASPAKVVAVSPIVAGDIVKGPTEAFMAWAGFELTATGVADFYGDVLDGMVSDEREAGDLPVAVLDTLMSDAQSRERVAREALRFAEALAS
jgi:LPPG:FO 2-phospho-L-lactate transferase